MKEVRFAAFALISVLFSVSAHAQTPVPYSWTGAYVGLNVGGESNKLNTDFLTPANSSANASQTFTDVVYGAHFGAQYQWQRWVIGAEAAYMRLGSPDKRAESSCHFPNPFDDRCDGFSATNIWTLGGRLGYSPMNWDRLLIFGTGGWARSDVKTAIRFGGVGVPPAPNAIPETQLTSTVDGYYVGGGIEYALSRMWWLGAEYQHIKLDDTPQCVGTCATSILNRNVKSSTDLGRVRLSFRPM